MVGIRVSVTHLGRSTVVASFPVAELGGGLVQAASERLGEDAAESQAGGAGEGRQLVSAGPKTT
jgi:hypothetical protein